MGIDFFLWNRSSSRKSLIGYLVFAVLVVLPFAFGLLLRDAVNAVMAFKMPAPAAEANNRISRLELEVLELKADVDHLREAAIQHDSKETEQ